MFIYLGTPESGKTLRKKKDPEEIKKMIVDFNNIVVPWCKKKKLSLHQAFEISRKTDKEKYMILINLWRTYLGKAYLKSAFSRYGGRLRETGD